MLVTTFVIQKEIIRKITNAITLNLPIRRIPVTFTYKNWEPEFLWMRQNPPVFSGIIPIDRISNVPCLPTDAIDPRFPVKEVSTGLSFIIVPVKKRNAVRKAKINQEAYTDLICTTAAKAVFIFCPEPYYS
jgi:trans-2,3-dihydro-3-hydroxyanthranilate isomerase